MNRFVPALAAMVVAIAGTACSSDNTLTTPTTTATTATPVTDVFAGTLSVNGGASHVFATQRDGSVTAVVTAVSPSTAPLVGLSLGTWNGAACQTVLANDKATLGTSLTAVASAAGSFCVRIYDVGSLTETQTYELQVQHP